MAESKAPADPWRSYKVTIAPLKRGEATVDPEDPDSDGLKTKFGGKPDWIQECKWPNCRKCRQPLSFVGQIDSFEHESKKNPNSKPAGKQNFMFVDVGMLYVFYCIGCGKPDVLLQHY